MWCCAARVWATTSSTPGTECLLGAAWSAKVETPNPKTLPIFDSTSQARRCSLRLALAHRLHSSSFLGIACRILNINHKKELLRSLWVECWDRFSMEFQNYHLHAFYLTSSPAPQCGSVWFIRTNKKNKHLYCSFFTFVDTNMKIFI